MENSQFVQSVRYLNGIRIYFKDKSTIEVSDSTTAIAIRRWPSKGGGTYHQSWYPFCRKLQRRNGITSIHQIATLSSRYNLLCSRLQVPHEPPAGVLVRPSRYIRKERKCQG